MVKAKLNIDVGCGSKCQPGFVGMDKRMIEGHVDVVHDIEEIPWPFESGSADIIKMSHIIEHIKPWLTIEVINECWRILKTGGHLLIAAPYGANHRFVQDPTHCNPVNELTFGYFCPLEKKLYEVYEPPPWKMTHLYWHPHGDIEVAMIKMNGGS